MKNVKTLLLLAAVSLMTTACNKFEDGPMFSLRSIEERVANNWRIEKAIDNGNDVSGDFDKYDISLREDKSSSITAHYSFVGIDYDYTYDGTWSLQSNDEKIVIDYEDADDVSYFILKLKEKELWVREEGTNLELHLVPM